MAKDLARLSWCLIDGRPVFMDLGNDSYFMLEPDDEAAFLRSGSGGGTPFAIPSRLAGALGTGSLIVTDIKGCASPQESALAQKHAGGAPSTNEILRAWFFAVAARHSIRRKSIVDIIGNIEGNSAAGRLPAALPNAAARFAAARRFVAVPPNCLTDSIALLRWLGKLGDGACLVFGVKLNPFAAHCWVQFDRVLLNDYPEHVERFTPVRIIRCNPGLR